MSKQQNKDLKAQFLERKQEMGIFQISFEGIENIWVGAAPDISTIQNRIVFTLKHGNAIDNDLTYMYKHHGEAKMRFEIMEKMEFEPDAYLRRGILKTKIAHWAETRNVKIMRI